MGFPSLVGSTAVCPEVSQCPSVLVLPCSLAAGCQISLLSQLEKVGLQREPEPCAELELQSKTGTSLWARVTKSLLGATRGKMCAVLKLNHTDVMYSRLSPCFTKREKGSCTGAGQLANFLVLRRLAQLWT